MTDRELLELAAKAAGYEYTMHHHGGQDYSLAINGVYWYPLHDDGDALRLAVKLNLRIVFHPVFNQALVREYFVNGREWVENGENHSDPLAATRRAIVVAAAEIGRNMK